MKSDKEKKLARRACSKMIEAALNGEADRRKFERISQRFINNAVDRNSPFIDSLEQLQEVLLDYFDSCSPRREWEENDDEELGGKYQEYIAQANRILTELEEEEDEE